MYAATAPGFVANPRLVADQVMGTAIQGTSQALHEQVTFNKSNVTSLDWVSYPVLRFKDHPDVTPIVIQRLDELPGGAGEEPITALFGAIANAFFDATGVRLHQVPMTPAVTCNALAWPVKSSSARRSEGAGRHGAPPWRPRSTTSPLMKRSMPDARDT